MHRFGSLSALAAATTVAAAIALPAAAQAAPTTIAAAHGGTQLAAYGGDAAWSQYDEATGRWSLVVSRDGAAAVPAAVPERTKPFDVDLGTNRSGTTFAVYSRCASDQEGGTGCDLYRLGLTPGATETKLTNLSSPSADEQDPTIFAGRIAYVRDERVRGQVGQTLRFGTTTSGAGDGTVIASSTAKEGSILRPELNVGQVAYVVGTKGRHGFGAQTVRIRDLGGRQRARTVYTATSGGANFASITNIALQTGTGNAFLFARTNQGSGAGNRIFRYNAATGGLREATGNANYSSIGSRAGGDVLAVEDSIGGQDAASAVLDLGAPGFAAGAR